MCDLNSFDVILGNIFLNAYKKNIFHKQKKLRIYGKVGSKLMNLNGDYNSTKTKVEINLVVLTKELESPNFVVLMSLGVSKGEPKPKGTKQPIKCILDPFNKFSKVLTNECFYFFHPIKRLTTRLKCCMGQLHHPRHLIG
jgi:hypothetical protein